MILYPITTGTTEILAQINYLQDKSQSQQVAISYPKRKIGQDQEAMGSFVKNQNYFFFWGSFKSKLCSILSYNSNTWIFLSILVYFQICMYILISDIFEWIWFVSKFIRICLILYFECVRMKANQFKLYIWICSTVVDIIRMS